MEGILLFPQRTVRFYETLTGWWMGYECDVDLVIHEMVRNPDQKPWPVALFWTGSPMRGFTRKYQVCFTDQFVDFNIAM